MYTDSTEVTKDVQVWGFEELGKFLVRLVAIAIPQKSAPVLCQCSHQNFLLVEWNPIIAYPFEALSHTIWV